MLPIGTYLGASFNVPVSHMSIARPRFLGQKYAFLVVAVIFVCLLAAAGLRSSPSVLLVPWEKSFGWSRDTTSLAAAIGIFLYGLVGPFAAALMQSFGIRRTLLCALALMSGATMLSTLMTEAWHLIATWGVLTGLGSGAIALVMGATITNRWFATNRGLVMGLLTASTATGTLIFIPLLSMLAELGGWSLVTWTVALAAAALIPLVWWLLPERPSDMGLLPYGATEAPAAAGPAQNPLVFAVAALGRASKKADFWFLFATFWICGFTTNGLVGTHLLSFCGDMGLAVTTAAGVLALMGFFDLFGTTASGWLTDRYDPRKLLFMYYGLRGLSLVYLPYTDFSLASLSVFAVFYGLDWIATVPPTVKLANEAFGERDAPVVFGWIAAGHQLGAASAAFFAGWMRVQQGDYLQAFIIAGVTAVIAAGLSLLIKGKKQAALAVA